MKKIVMAIAIAGVLLVACGDDGPGAAAAPTTSLPGDGVVSDPTPMADDGGDATSAPMGPGISVAELLATTAEGPYLVNGFVLVSADGTAVLAEALAESFPPQPAGEVVPIRGFDLMALPLTETVDDGEIEVTAWTDLPVQLLGDLVDGELVAHGGSSA